MGLWGRDQCLGCVLGARHFTLKVLFYLGVQIGWKKFLGKPD